MKRVFYITALGLSVFTASAALAADGYLTGDVTLRAGPDSNYPVVAILGAGTPVAIEGCVDGWSWCDVVTGDNRGWVSGSFLQEEYQGQRVLVPAYGVQIGIPVISFVLGAYWDSYYRNRPWYGERDHWSQFRPAYRPVAASNGYRATGHRNAYGNTHTTYVPSSHDAHQTRHPGEGSTVAAPHSKPANTQIPQHNASPSARPASSYASHTVPVAHNAGRPVSAKPALNAGHPQERSGPAHEKIATKQQDHDDKDQH